MILAVFGGALVGASALALVLTLLASSAPEPEPERCRYPDVCGPPSRPAELIVLTSWESPLGYALRYDADAWVVDPEDDAGLSLRLFGREDAVLHVTGSTTATPAEALDAYVGALAERVPDLAEDRRTFRVVYGPAVGFVDGVGASYSGHVATAQGPGPVVTMSAMAAEVDGVTVLVSMEMTGGRWIKVRGDGWLGEVAFEAADSVINTVEWTAS